MQFESTFNTLLILSYYFSFELVFFSLGGYSEAGGSYLGPGRHPRLFVTTGGNGHKSGRGGGSRKVVVHEELSDKYFHSVSDAGADAGGGDRLSSSPTQQQQQQQQVVEEKIVTTESQFQLTVSKVCICFF